VFNFCPRNRTVFGAFKISFDLEFNFSLSKDGVAIISFQITTIDISNNYNLINKSSDTSHTQCFAWVDNITIQRQWVLFPWTLQWRYFLFVNDWHKSRENQ
jgi:hypothetical protein